MAEMLSALDRLEARLEYQTARIDTLYALLEEHGILERPVRAQTSDALFDELVQIEDAPFARERLAPRPRRRQARRLHVGNATGV